jgi:hypothetical protein
MITVFVGISAGIIFGRWLYFKYATYPSYLGLAIESSLFGIIGGCLGHILG